MENVDNSIVQVIDRLIKKEEYKILYKALAELNLQQREVILLFYFENLSIREIAAITNETEANVRVILHRGRKRLKEILEVNYEV